MSPSPPPSSFLFHAANAPTAATLASEAFAIFDPMILLIPRILTETFDAILLVDFVINAGRSSATNNLDEAIIGAGRARLRPILMTALAFGIEGGGSVLVSSSLAIPVIGGLITSTLLTLIVVPVGYSLLREPRRKKGAEKRE